MGTIISGSQILVPNLLCTYILFYIRGEINSHDVLKMKWTEGNLINSLQKLDSVSKFVELLHSDSLLQVIYTLSNCYKDVCYLHHAKGFLRQSSE